MCQAPHQHLYLPHTSLLLPSPQSFQRELDGGVLDHGSIRAEEALAIHPWSSKRVAHGSGTQWNRTQACVGQRASRGGPAFSFNGCFTSQGFLFRTNSPALWNVCAPLTQAHRSHFLVPEAKLWAGAWIYPRALVFTFTRRPAGSSEWGNAALGFHRLCLGDSGPTLSLSRVFAR